MSILYTVMVRFPSLSVNVVFHAHLKKRVAPTKYILIRITYHFVFPKFCEITEYCYIYISLINLHLRSIVVSSFRERRIFRTEHPWRRRRPPDRLRCSRLPGTWISHRRTKKFVQVRHCSTSVQFHNPIEVGLCWLRWKQIDFDKEKCWSLEGFFQRYRIDEDRRRLGIECIEKSIAWWVRTYAFIVENSL